MTTNPNDPAFPEIRTRNINGDYPELPFIGATYSEGGLTKREHFFIEGLKALIAAGCSPDVQSTYDKATTIADNAILSLNTPQ